MKLKVIYIIDTLNGSGAEKSLAEITSHFKETRAIFVHLYKGDMLKPFLQEKGIKVYSLDIDKKYGFKEAISQLKKIYKEENPDLIHSTLYRSDMVARKMKVLFPNIPLIGSFVNNSYTPLRYKDKNLFMKLKLWLAYQLDFYSAKKVDFFISNSNTIKKDEGNALNIPESKIKVIYRGRDFRKFDAIDLEDSKKIKMELGLSGKKVLVNVSRLIERKGQMDLIRIMPDILKTFPDTILVIAGHGTYKEYLEKEITALNLNNNVKLLGRYSKIPELLSIADIFVYPSYAEGLPGSLIEAMMASCVIINSDIGENLECVGSDTSLTFPVGDLAHLKQKILEVLENPDNFISLGLHAKKVAVEKFSIETIALEYESTYKKMIC